MMLTSAGGGTARESRLVNRNVVAERGRTSMRLEPELWEALSEICDREDRAIGDLIRQAEQSAPAGSRPSAVRVYIVRYFREAATETGHRHAGHGAGISGGVGDQMGRENGA